MKAVIRVFLVFSIMLLASCSTISTEEMSEEIGKQIEEEVGKAFDKATEEGIKKAGEALTIGKDKVDSILSELIGSGIKEAPQSNEKVDVSGTSEQIPVELITVIDGDTIKIFHDKVINGRLLLVDAPEITNGKNQPFGFEAAERINELLKDGILTIEFDVGEKMDKYGRLLFYAYSNGEDIGLTLVREGLARVRYVYPPNTRYLDTYKEAEEQAKIKGLGIWSIENYADTD